jgi:hypothetical protein
MEPLISMAAEFWNALAPTTWFLVLGLPISLISLKKSPVLNSAIQITVPAF